MKIGHFKQYVYLGIAVSLLAHIGLGLQDDKEEGPLLGMLEADTCEVSALSGGTVTFLLDASGENWNRPYILLGSLSGTHTGIPMPGSEAFIPLKWDAYTDFVLSMMNTPYFEDFAGILDGMGKAEAKLVIPPLSQEHVGITMYFAYGVCGPNNLASLPVTIEIVP